MDILEISQSWFRSTFHNREQQELAEERAAICETCDQKAKSSLGLYFVCRACGCPLKPKVYSARGPRTCTKGKWVR